MRIINSIIGLLCILLFIWLVQLYSRNIYSTSVTFLLITFNPLLLNYFRKAMMDSLSSIMLIISGMFVWVAVNKLFSQKMYSSGMFIAAGISVGVASSLKINGLFLLILPIWLITVKFVTMRKLNLSIFSKTVVNYVFFLAGFCLIFTLLEPITWQSPLAGLESLITARLQQQQRFFTAFRHINYVFMPMFALFTFFSQIQIALLLPIFISLNAGFTHITTKALNKNSLEILMISVLLFIFSVNFYYAQTGFDRYLIPTVLALLFIQSIGLKIIFDKIKQYVP